MKFRDGYMVKTGHSAVLYQDYATRHVMMRQGIMGVRVRIMLPRDPEGLTGPKDKLADVVEIKPDGTAIHSIFGGQPSCVGFCYVRGSLTFNAKTFFSSSFLAFSFFPKSKLFFFGALQSLERCPFCPQL
jgi:hypothetical protein